jgi:hypothetical protein
MGDAQNVVHWLLHTFYTIIILSPKCKLTNRMNMNNQFEMCGRKQMWDEVQLSHKNPSV